ncbi:protein yicc [hydrocarbon metagenome]|uniref:Protein yicc n=1 Tax=hydrocarbon metagenome TaxID=938273 RepID=A0A0W8E567_9ZZZZ
MVRSMTGFGRSQIDEGGYQISCEIRGVNHRFFDPHIRMPRRYSVLEEKIKEEIKKHIQRGRIEVNINVDKTDDSRRTLKVDKGLALAYYNYLKELAENLNISKEIRVIDVFRLPEVFNLQDEQEDLELLWEILQKAVQTAVTGVLDMREKEGQNLVQDILARNNLISSYARELEERAPAVEVEYRNKMQSRILELLDQEMLDENRLLQEVAIFADKTSITEEIVRLQSHVQHLRDLLAINDAVGRKCDFLVQEMFREINTISSKSSDLKMSQIVVDVKAEVEKIREQLQNIE